MLWSELKYNNLSNIVAHPQIITAQKHCDKSNPHYTITNEQDLCKRKKRNYKDSLSAEKFAALKVKTGVLVRDPILVVKTTNTAFRWASTSSRLLSASLSRLPFLWSSDYMDIFY